MHAETRLVVWPSIRSLAASAWARVIIVALGLKCVVLIFGGDAVSWFPVLDSAATIGLVVALGCLLLQQVSTLQRRLLWRVRRRLLLSYILIGLVPVVLLVSFFLIAGFLLTLTVSSALVRLSLSEVVDDASALVTATVTDLQGLQTPSDVRLALEGRVESEVGRYPGASIVFLESPIDGAAPGRGTQVSGPWAHTSDLPKFPQWLSTSDESVVMTEVMGRSMLAARAGRRVDIGQRRAVVIADLPLTGSTIRQIEATSGTVLLEAAAGVGAFEVGTESVSEQTISLGRSGGAGETLDGLSWASFFDLRDWVTGEQGLGGLTFQVRPAGFYALIVQGVDLNFARALLFVLFLVGAMFLAIEAAALTMGFTLAKSITGAVHELFAGTERIRRGDLAHRIRVETGDQLGELAVSFNAMTGSIAGLLEQAEEKRRLEEELRIARDIQMSLLPQGAFSLPGLTVSASCIPAREVGGDYYDFVPLDDRRLGVIVADVSGKGTSAAFYMAELKGVLLSLSRIYQSPRRLLIEANRILSGNLDSRTFITILYAVLDLNDRTLTYARAGHTPLIHVTSKGVGTACSRALAPGGVAVGWGFENMQERFKGVLEERTVTFSDGDLFALFTDGITEAMNEGLDLFGEDRLCRLLEEHARSPLETLRKRIVGDVTGFVGDAEQHDDMTLVLFRVDGSGVVGQPVVRQA